MAKVFPAIAAAATSVAGVLSMRPPTAAGEDAPSDAFSATRAMRHVRQVARTAHPAGSAAAAEVREYLVSELTALGFDVEVQNAVAVGSSTPTPYGPRYLGAGAVQNIIARRAGAQPGRAVALMTHYDSVAQGPGANDAGVPIAALLETARALAADPLPRNDIVLLLTDGEECGLLGARAFFAEHPLAATIGAAFNFEARGVRPPLLMFETTPGNGPLISELAASGVPVVGSSLFYEVYRRLPNATDFSISKNHGVPGLNFAHVGGFVHYHGPLDDVAHVDPRLLQQHGDLALALARRLGSADLDQLAGKDEVFFTVGRELVHYPVAAAGPLAAAGAAGLLAATGRQLRHAPLEAAGALGRVVGSGAIATALAWALCRLRPESRRGGDFYESDSFYAALVALTAAGGLATARKSVSGVGLPLAAASTALAAKLPGASYLTTWPVLGASVAAATSGARSPVVRTVGRLAAALPAAALLAPLSRLLFQGLTPRMAATSASTMQLAWELAGPAVSELPAPLRRRLAVVAAATGVALLVRAAWPRRGADTPRLETLSYLLDADTGRAWWISSDRTSTPWTRRVLGDRPTKSLLPQYFPGWTRPFLSAQAPAADLTPPEVRILAEQATGDRRRVLLEIRSPRSARQITVTAPDGDIAAWSVDDRAITATEAEAGEPGQPWELWLHALPAKGFRLELDLPASPVRMRVADRSDGLAGDLRDLLLAAGPEPTGRADSPALDVNSWENATFVSRWLTV